MGTGGYDCVTIPGDFTLISASKQSERGEFSILIKRDDPIMDVCLYVCHLDFLPEFCC